MTSSAATAYTSRHYVIVRDYCNAMQSKLRNLQKKLIPSEMYCFFLLQHCKVFHSSYTYRKMCEEAIEFSAHIWDIADFRYTKRRAGIQIRILVAHYLNETSEKKKKRGHERARRQKNAKDTRKVKLWIRGNFPANDFVTEFHSQHAKGDSYWKHDARKLGRGVSKRGMLRILTSRCLFTCGEHFTSEISLCIPESVREKNVPSIVFIFVNLCCAYITLLGAIHLFSI